jgi:hypothetical protein
MTLLMVVMQIPVCSWGKAAMANMYEAFGSAPPSKEVEKLPPGRARTAHLPAVQHIG